MERKSRRAVFCFCFLRRRVARPARLGLLPGRRRQAALGVRGLPEPSLPPSCSPARNETALSTGACNSIQNADASIPATRLVRITHPFHPLSGRQLPCVGERYNRYGMTLLLQIDDESICSVPPQWTDVVAVDPEIAMGGRRALFRVVDLLELAGLVDRLSKRICGRAKDAV